jgi:hypothetical protein
VSASSDLLRILVPEFASVVDYPDAVVDVFLDTAALQHDAGSFGQTFQIAMIYFTAHLLASVYPAGAGSSVGSGSSGGAIASKKAGDLSVSYGAASGGVAGGVTLGDADLMTTSYGRRYLSIRNSRSARGPRVVIGT